MNYIQYKKRCAHVILWYKLIISEKNLFYLPRWGTDYNFRPHRERVKHQIWQSWVKFWKQFACGAIDRNCFRHFEKRGLKVTKTQSLKYKGCFRVQYFLGPLSPRYNEILKILPYFELSKKIWYKYLCTYIEAIVLLYTTAPKGYQCIVKPNYRYLGTPAFTLSHDVLKQWKKVV